MHDEPHARPERKSRTAALDAVALRQRAWRDARRSLLRDQRRAQRSLWRSLRALGHDARRTLGRRHA